MLKVSNGSTKLKVYGCIASNERDRNLPKYEVVRKIMSNFISELMNLNNVLIS